jgi:hypothetical protein
MIARLVYSAIGPYRWASHLNVAAEIERWIRRAGLALEYSQGFNPRPKISFGPAKPVGMSGYREIADISLVSTDPTPDVKFDQEFPGAKNGSFDPQSLRFLFSGEIAEENGVMERARDWMEAGAPNWWMETVQNIEPRNLEKDAVSLGGIWTRMAERRAPHITPIGLRLLENGEGTLSKIVSSSLVFAKFEFENQHSRALAAEFLCGRSWIVEAGASRAFKDVRPYAESLHVSESQEALSVFLRAKSSASESLPFVRVADKVAELGGITAECARVLFLDAKGAPVG